MSLRFISEDFVAWQVSPEELDALLAEGWRHFGIYFFRYNLALYEGRLFHVLPLRIRLENFKLSKSLRRILKRNSDLEIRIDCVEINDEKLALFEQHKTRFKFNIPNSIYDFISPFPSIPCQTMELSAFLNGKLIACSFFDVGFESVSSVYGMFDIKESVRSLGILTMLLEIDYAIRSGKRFLYQGYAYEEKSFYDYKKRFLGTERYDWKDRKWKPLMSK